jgi:hypothetical protein
MVTAEGVPQTFAAEGAQQTFAAEGASQTVATEGASQTISAEEAPQRVAADGCWWWQRTGAADGSPPSQHRSGQKGGEPLPSARPLLQTNEKREIKKFYFGSNRRKRTSTSWTPPPAGISRWRRVCKGGQRNDWIIPATQAQTELYQSLDLLADSSRRMNQIIRAAMPGGSWERN